MVLFILGILVNSVRWMHRDFMGWVGIVVTLARTNNRKERDLTESRSWAFVYTRIIIQ